MLTKSKFGLTVLAVLSVSGEALGRLRLMERDDHPVLLDPRRFGQENPAVIQKLSQACDGQICGNLAGAAVTPLLAAQPECSQQDMADKIIDAARKLDVPTQAIMIALAIEYRKTEKNTPPDFTTNPPTPRNSVFCQKAPKNPELNGLVQAQDPANGDIFFDPATKASVKRGDQQNTLPFGQSNGGVNNSGGKNATNKGNAGGNSNGADTGNIGGNNNGTETGTNGGNAGAAGNSTASPPCEATVTVTVAPAATESATATATPTSGANNGNAGGAAGAIGDFGSCSVPEIEFGQGFDNRKETSFEPVDKKSYNHGSAQAFNIIAQFICDTLTNQCKADETAKDTCKNAQDAGNAATAKTGAQADAFNAAFGIKTNFAEVQPIDDQGRPVGSTTGTNSTGNSTDTGNANTGNTSNTGVGNNAGNNTGAGAGAEGNLQTFTETLGGVVAPTVTASGNGEFQVEGNASFNALRNAVVRSCDVQNNQCSNAANGSGNKGDLTVANCNAQQQRCIAAGPQ